VAPGEAASAGASRRQRVRGERGSAVALSPPRTGSNCAMQHSLLSVWSRKLKFTTWRRSRNSK